MPMLIEEESRRRRKANEEERESDTIPRPAFAIPIYI
jgi:hypothetical protein